MKKCQGTHKKEEKFFLILRNACVFFLLTTIFLAVLWQMDEMDDKAHLFIAYLCHECPT